MIGLFCKRALQKKPHSPRETIFCKRDLQKRLYSAKKTCNCREPTDRIPDNIGPYFVKIPFLSKMIGLRDLKLQVCFAEYSLFYRALLQKRPNTTQQRAVLIKMPFLSRMLGLKNLNLHLSFAKET